MKSHLGDIQIVKQQLATKVDEKQVRQLLADRIDPVISNLQSDIKELNTKLDKIMDFLIEGKK